MNQLNDVDVNLFYNGEYVNFYQSINDLKYLKFETERDLSSCIKYPTKKAYMQSIAYGVGDFETKAINDKNRQELIDFNKTLESELEIDLELSSMAQKVDIVCGFFALWNQEFLGKIHLQRDGFHFLKMLMSLPYRKIYLDFHNLAFDGVFIIYHLEKMGFKNIHDDVCDMKLIKSKVDMSEKAKEEFMQDKCYKLSVRKGQWYELSIYWVDDIKIKNKTYKVQRQIRLYDTLKITQISLEKSVEAYTGIESPDKKGWDYAKDYKRDVAFTKKELSYIKFDSLAYLCMAYEIRVNQGITNKTASGFAYSHFRSNIKKELEDFYNGIPSKIDFINSDECRELKYFYKNQEEIARQKMMDDEFFIPRNSELDKSRAFVATAYKKYVTPQLTRDTFEELRLGYTGGHSWYNEETCLKAIEEGKNFGMVFDVNSLYPSVMSEVQSLEKLLGTEVYYPYGSPILSIYPDYESNKNYVKDKYPCSISKITISNAKIKSNKVPTLRTSKQSKYGINPRDYLKQTINVEGEKFSITTWKTNYEIEDIKMRYNCEITFHKTYLFRGTKNIFKSFVDINYQAKQTAKGVKRSVAKLILNSTYGKFGTNLISTVSYPVLEDDVLKLKTIKDDIGEDIEVYDEQSFNIALACFITTFARLTLFKVVDTLLERGFSPVYQDTDSCHIVFKDIDEMKGIIDTMMELNVLDVNNTGERMLWKLEGVFSNYKYVGPKKYYESINEDATIQQLLKIKSTSELEELINANKKEKYNCAGLSTKDLIVHNECFCVCSNSKEIKKMWDDGKLYYHELVRGQIVNPHLYYDEELKHMVKGAFLNKKKKSVNGGIVIETTIYIVTPKLLFGF